VVKNPACCTFK